MSTDAREAWQQRAADWVAFVLSAHVTALASGDRSELDEELNNLQKHLRTTPEGYALVPVPEWMPFDDLVSYPAPESSGWFWYIKDDEIFRGTAMQVCLARGVTYWCPADNPPAPPKSEPL
jgi:hypothetical protein